MTTVVKEMLRGLSLLASITVALSVPAFAQQPGQGQASAVLQGSSQDSRKEEIAAVLNKWIAAMNAKQGTAPLMELYADDAALFATMNPALLTTPEQRLANFNGLADIQKAPGFKCELGDFVTHVFADAAVNTGFYTFSFVTAEGPAVHQFRFSFVYRKSPRGWLIVSHHSSPKPQKNLSPQPKSN